MNDTEISDKAINAIMLYSTLNSSGIKDFLNVDVKKFKRDGETLTLYENMSLENIIVRLMDNRDFKSVPDSVKREMFYTDYYPDEAKTSYDVYMDDRRNLCQELHNKLCEKLQIPETKVKFVDFRDTELDEDLFERYNPFDGILYINTMIKYSECDKTELVERVMRGTYMHQVYTELKDCFGNFSKVDGVHRYLLLSSLSKLIALSSLSDENLNGVRREMEYSDGYSAGMVYSICSTYELLHSIFEENKIYEKIDLEEFKEQRLCYLKSLDDEEFYGEKDDDDEFDFPDDFGEDEDEYVSEVEDGILYDTVGYDLDILHIIDTSVLNEQVGGVVFKVLIEEIDKCAKDFYGFFGSTVETSFAEQYAEYKRELNEEIAEDEKEEE